MTGRKSISRAFCERWGERTPEAAARKALESAIPGAARSAVPVNLDAAARFVGIEQVLEAEMTEADGLLQLAPSGTYIASLRSGQGVLRKRFTLAHEIGHAIVYRSATQASGLPHSRQALRCGNPGAADRDEERLCDIVATELLMPRTQFREKMEQLGVCAATIPQFSREFAVSLQAASRRVAQLAGYDLAVGFWTEAEQSSRLLPKWYVTEEGAKSVDYVIEPGGPGSACFGDLPVRGWHWIPLQGHMEKYYVDVCPLRATQRAWLLLVVFSDAARQILGEISKGQPPPAVGQLPLWDE